MKTNAGPKKCQTNEKKTKIKFSKYLLVSATLNFEILQNKCTQNNIYIYIYIYIYLFIYLFIFYCWFFWSILVEVCLVFDYR